MKRILTLHCGKWSARIDPAYGANLIALTHNGADVLRPLPEHNDDPFVVGAPLLLPANRTAGARFSFGGKEYTLPANDRLSGAHLHGRLYNAPFTVESVTENAAVLSYENHGEIYPFAFLIRVSYILSEEGLRSIYYLENRADAAMPFTFGLHTTFAEPECFRVPLRDRQEKDACHIPTGRYVPLTELEERYVTGSPSQDVIISGYYRAAGDTAQIGSAYRYQVTGFDHWILYNARGTAGFLCVEPQLGGVNGLNDPEHCPVLQPHATVTLETNLHSVL